MKKSWLLFLFLKWKPPLLVVRRLTFCFQGIMGKWLPINIQTWNLIGWYLIPKVGLSVIFERPTRPTAPYHRVFYIIKRPTPSTAQYKRAPHSIEYPIPPSGPCHWTPHIAERPILSFDPYYWARNATECPIPHNSQYHRVPNTT